MSSPGATELLIVLVIVLLILGPKRLPSLGRQLGGGIRELRKSIGGGDAAAAPGSERRPPARHADRGDSASDGIGSERRSD